MILKVDVRTGRINVSGPNKAIAAALPGAAENKRRGTYELSLTLETLRRLRAAAGMSKEEFARCCTMPVLAWAKAAGRSEQVVSVLHSRIANGWRAPMPWYDNRAGTQAHGGADEDQVEYVDGRWQWKYRAPMEAQTVMASVASSLDGAALICGMGTGKTRAALETIQHKFDNGELTQCIVVCLNSGFGTWEREATQWTRGVRIVRLDARYTVRERANIIAGDRSDRTVFVLNYEALGAKLVKGGMERLKDTLVQVARERKVGIVLDEMHKCKTPTARVTQAAMEVARVATWRLGQTGTPTSNGAEDVWSEWYIVDLGVTFGANYVQFKREFFKAENPYTHELQPQEGTLSEIAMRMRRRGVFYAKEDCMDLPRKTFEIVEVEMTREQERAYREMEEELITMFADTPDDDSDAAVATASTQLVSILRLTQITSGFVPTDRGLHFFDVNPKADALEEIVREQIRESKEIIWARYRPDVERLMQRFRDLNPIKLYGGMGVGAADRAEEAIQHGDTRLLIANQQTGGAGLNLFAVNLSHFFSQDYSLINREQAEDRTHRKGSERHDKITFIDYVCKDTVDEDVRESLVNKLDTAEVIRKLRRRIGL